MSTFAESGKKSSRTRKTRATLRRCAARATVSRPPNEEEVRSGIFLKLLACFLVVILAAAVMFDLMLGGAWESSLRGEIERNLIQKTKLLAHRVETDRSGRSLSDIAAQEAKAAGARVTIIDPAGKVLVDSESNTA